MIKIITVQELNVLFQTGQKITLIDVREPYEVEIATIGGTLVSLGNVPNEMDKFDSNAEMVVVYCRSGKRSALAIEHLQNITNQENLYNLEGGILKWADEIDSSLTKY